MKILIIDDEDDIRRIARLGLARVGKMDVIDANGGAEGIRKAEDEKPDAILLDVMMPVMDGPATLNALKNNPATASIPVIFLTAKAMASEIERLKSLGALDVLTKPFDPMKLASQVRAVLEEK
jgi:CheY-like chemotaxis protein